MNNVKMTIRSILVISGCFFLTFFASPVYGQPEWSTGGEKPARLKDIEVVFEKIISVALQLAGVAFFIMLLAGGFQFLTAGANPKTLEKAQNTLTYAFLGLILTVGAWVILRAIATITGLNITVFKIPIE